MPDNISNTKESTYINLNRTKEAIKNIALEKEPENIFSKEPEENLTKEIGLQHDMAGPKQTKKIFTRG